ncbi:Crossover junction endonuclease EME1B, partial [Cucurbita argyrosperma subsp. argyrosperma]
MSQPIVLSGEEDGDSTPYPIHSKKRRTGSDAFLSIFSTAAFDFLAKDLNTDQKFAGISGLICLEFDNESESDSQKNKYGHCDWIDSDRDDVKNSFLHFLLRGENRSVLIYGTPPSMKTVDINGSVLTGNDVLQEISRDTKYSSFGGDDGIDMYQVDPFKKLAKLTTHFVKVRSRQCVDETEAADILTCSLASFQFRKKLTHLSVNAIGSIIPKDCVRRNVIKKCVRLEVLVAIPKVQPRFSVAIWKKYPTMKSFSKVYMNSCKSVHEKEFLLKDLTTEAYGDVRFGFEDKTKSYSFNGTMNKEDEGNPELKRKQRVATYNMYSLEGKLKKSLRKSFK